METNLAVRSPLTNMANQSDSALDMSSSAICPRCGTQHDAQSRISELEAQVKLLTTKASSAVDKLADYEDELRKLKGQPPPSKPPDASSSSDTVAPTANGAPSPPASIEDPVKAKALPPTPAPGEVATLHHRPSVKGRLGSFLTRSNSLRPATGAAPSGPTARETDLAAALTQERTLREAAEGKVTLMSSEMEDLSVTLFQQANEMVASEREARAKLEARAARFEERCGVLEEKVALLERRDGEKRKRLERLELAVARVERVRKVLDVR